MNDHVIMCDIDGVIADFVYAFTALGNVSFNTPVIFTADMTTWSGFGMDEEKEQILWHYINGNPDWWNTLPLACSFDEITTLVNLPGIYFATNRPKGSLAVTTQWLGRYSSHRPRVIVTQDKVRLMQALEPEWVLEDSPHNLVTMRRVPVNTRVVRFRLK